MSAAIATRTNKPTRNIIEDIAQAPAYRPIATQATPSNATQTQAPADASKFVDLVFEGGGVKGIAMVGALSVLEERGYMPQNLAGTSAGAIVATLLAAGYTAAELREVISTLDFSRFTDTDWLGRIPVAGASLHVLTDQGIYKGEAFLSLMRKLLLVKGVRTFRDLRYTPPAGYGAPDSENHMYKVQVVASDLTDHSFLVLPSDAHKLGIEPDDLEVALAVRMSMSIPIFFEPVRFRNPRTGEEHIIVDGGVLSTYPIWLFDTEGVPEWPTFGLHLLTDPAPADSDEARPAKKGRSLMGRVEGIQYLTSLYFTMKGAHDRLYIEEHNFARTIAIPTLGVRMTEFNLTKAKANALYESGRKAAEEFLGSWDFQGYIAECRSGKPQPSRRQQIAEKLHQAAANAVTVQPQMSALAAS
jgi:NTE family protein